MVTHSKDNDSSSARLNTADADADAEPPRDAPAVIGAELERLSAAIITAINAKDFDFESAGAREAAAHVSPHWIGTIDTQPGQVSWEQQKASWKERARTHPDVIFDIRSMLTDVDVKRGVATVHMVMDVTGWGDLRLQAINDMTWVRQQGEMWFCLSTLGMRGTPCADGF